MKIRELKFENSKLGAEITFVEQEKASLIQQNQLDKSTNDEIIESKEKEISSLNVRMKFKVNELTVDLDIKDAEIESLNDQINSKQIFITKLEQSFQSDIARVEKKLASQVSSLISSLNLASPSHSSPLLYSTSGKALR
jgi:hypothetical protein